MARRYRKKPIVIEAVKWTGDNHWEVASFMYPQLEDTYRDNPDGKGNFKVWHKFFPNLRADLGKEMGELVIGTLEGDHYVSVGDYIIKGIAGEFYPCKPNIFEMTYDEEE